MRYATTIVLLLAFVGCDTDATEDAGQRMYEVGYFADATFPECTVTYANEADGVSQDSHDFTDGPFELSFEVTVEEFDSFLAQLSVNCFGASSSRTVTGSISADETEVESGTAEGTSASISLDARFTIDGVE